MEIMGANILEALLCDVSTKEAEERGAAGPVKLRLEHKNRNRNQTQKQKRPLT